MVHAQVILQTSTWETPHLSLRLLVHAVQINWELSISSHCNEYYFSTRQYELGWRSSISFSVHFPLLLFVLFIACQSGARTATPSNKVWISFSFEPPYLSFPLSDLFKFALQQYTCCSFSVFYFCNINKFPYKCHFLATTLVTSNICWWNLWCLLFLIHIRVLFPPHSIVKRFMFPSESYMIFHTPLPIFSIFCRQYVE